MKPPFADAFPIDAASAEPSDAYLDFLRAKIVVAPSFGAPVDAGDVSPVLIRHQPDIVRWAVQGGRRAVFANFGLGKTLIQLEIMRLLGLRLGGRQLIVAPLNVILEGTFAADGAKIGIEPVFVRTTAEIHAYEAAHPGFWLRCFITNYESVRDGKIDLSMFNAATLDEADCLRGFGGSKTFREFMKLFDGMAFKLVATATPSPNDYIELLAYAAFLEVMDVGQAKTRFFRRNSEKADQLTLHPHKEAEFWLWVNSWAAFVQRPSDLGYSDEGYDLPPLDVRWHEVPSDHRQAGVGQERPGPTAEGGRDRSDRRSRAREARQPRRARGQADGAARRGSCGAHRLIWHDLEAERLAISAAVPGVASVYGSQDTDDRGRGRSHGSPMVRSPSYRRQAGDRWRRLQFPEALPLGDLHRDRLQVPRLHPGDPPHPALPAAAPGADRPDLHRRPSALCAARAGAQVARHMRRPRSG